MKTPPYLLQAIAAMKVSGRLELLVREGAGTELVSPESSGYNSSASSAAGERSPAPPAPLAPPAALRRRLASVAEEAADRADRYDVTCDSCETCLQCVTPFTRTYNVSTLSPSTIYHHESGAG